MLIKLKFNRKVVKNVIYNRLSSEEEITETTLTTEEEM